MYSDMWTVWKMWPAKFRTSGSQAPMTRRTVRSQYSTAVYGVRVGIQTGGSVGRYVVSTVRKIKSHCQEVHGWQNEQKRGRNVKQKRVQTANRMWDEGQAYQQFFTKPS
jgi:hypothetical protein